MKKEIHIKDHQIPVHDSIVKIDRKKKEITFSFKNAKYDSIKSSEILIDDLLAKLTDPYTVRVRGLTLTWSQWGTE